MKIAEEKFVKIPKIEMISRHLKYFWSYRHANSRDKTSKVRYICVLLSKYYSMTFNILALITIYVCLSSENKEKRYMCLKCLN